jgi:hypothetical protein
MSIVLPETPTLNPNLVPPPASHAPNEVIPDETLRFNYPGSDIILRSRDSYNFPLPKPYIVICSPVLRSLIESVSNTSDVPNGEESLPVVNIPESKDTLYSLLTFIFPVTPALPPTIEKILELLAVAQKYEINVAVSHIRGAIYLQEPPYLRLETAFHVYFLAQQHGLHREVVQAARLTLRFPMTIEGLGDELDFAGMTGAYLHELWKYHEQVRNELKSAVLQFRNTGLPDDVKSLRCTSPYYGYGTLSPQWLYEYIDSVAGTSPRHPFDLTEFEDARTRHVQSVQSRMINSYTHYPACSCATMPNQVKRSFWEAFTAVIHRVLEKVRRIGVTTRDG